MFVNWQNYVLLFWIFLFKTQKDHECTWLRLVTLWSSWIPQKPKALAWEIQRALNAEHRKKECHNERHLCVKASNIAAKVMKLFVFKGTVCSLQNVNLQYNIQLYSTQSCWNFQLHRVWSSCFSIRSVFAGRRRTRAVWIQNLTLNSCCRNMIKSSSPIANGTRQSRIPRIRNKARLRIFMKDSLCKIRAYRN